MAEASAPQQRHGRPWFSSPDDRAETLIAGNRHVEAALQRHKREGVELAVRARTIAMSVTGVMLLFIAPWPAVLVYEASLLLFIAIGFAQRAVARVGTNRAELALLAADLILLTVVALAPNPLQPVDWPPAFQYRFETFIYFFILLSTATLAYSWRTIFAFGIWTAVVWGGGSIIVWLSTNDPELSAAARAFYEGNYVLQDMMDPTAVMFDNRIQEVVVFIMCAFILGVSVRRFNNLLLAQASAERERTNLARYFSPNVVEQLSTNDEPLKQVRTQEIAVLFVDIVDFTEYAATHKPGDVIATLREFHGMMEAEVFRHDGTLDKFLGDGLMATFGTPVTGPEDALNALRCARSMISAVDTWNARRAEAGEPALKASFGLHYGPAVLGDIGGENRLEFAVVGNTVNVASRLEALSRPLGSRLVASGDLVQHVRSGGATSGDALEGLMPMEEQRIRGVPDPMPVWAMH